MKRPYYDYINNNISSCLGGNNPFDYKGNNLREFVFEYAGPVSCVDVTLQTMLDEMGEGDADGIYSEFVTWLTEVNGETLSDELLQEVFDNVVFHVGYRIEVMEFLTEREATI